MVYFQRHLHENIAKEEHISIDSVSRIIKKFGEHGELSDLPKTGQKQGPYNTNIEKKILQIYQRKPETSIRDIVQQASTSIGMVQRVKKRHNLKTYKKQKRPKRDPKQSVKALMRARKLYNVLRNKNEHCVIMDDETYCKYDYKTLPGPQYYTVRMGQDVSKVTQSISQRNMEIKC